MIARAVPYTLRNTHNTNRHVYESKHSSQSEQEAMAIYAHTTGITSFTSGKSIYHNGALYYGLPGSEFKFIAPEGITLTSNILNHRTTSTSVSAQLAVCGQPLIGSGRQLNPMNTVSYLDPTAGSLADFAHSSNIVEALVNGASSIHGISNMLGSIAQNGFMNTLASQMGASLILSLTKTAFDYQTEGAGGFYGGANIIMQTNGIATFAVNAYGKIATFEVTADELRILNTILKSKFTSESVSIAPSINLDGSYDLSASYAYQASSSIAQIQRNLSIGTFNLNVRYLHNRGANIVCNKINGKVDTIENENTVNTTTSTQTQVSASIQGNVSGNHVHATEETEGAKASILVTDGVNTDPEYNFEVNTVINHGDAKMSSLDPDTEVVHVDQTLKSTRVGGGFSHNFSKKANKPVTKLSVDLLNQISTLNEDGLTVTQRSKFKATVPVPKFTAPKTPPKEESFINLGEANASNALSGRRPSIIGDALRQLESNDFLVDPGYQYGRPSSVVADSEVKQSFKPSDLGLNSEDHAPHALRGKQYPNSPVVRNSQFSPLPFSLANKFNLKAGNINKISYTDATELVKELLAVPQGKGMLAAFAEAAVEVYKDTGKFLGEEAARLRLGEQTETSKIFHVVGQFIGEDVAKWHLGEDSFFKYTLTERGISRTFFTAVDYIVENDKKLANFITSATPEDWGRVAGKAAANYTLGMAQGAVINAPRIGANILKPLTFTRQMPIPMPISLELNNRMLTLKSEFASLSNVYDYRQLQRPILPLFRPLDYKGEPLKTGLRIYQEWYAPKQLPLKHDFINESELLKHFKKHGGEFKGMYQSPQDYLDGANFVINHGHKVKYQYLGQERIGYVRFMGNTRNLSVDDAIKNLSRRDMGLSKYHEFGEAKFEFLALRQDGTIATYHTQGAENFYHTLNQNSKNSTVNVEHLSCRMM